MRPIRLIAIFVLLAGVSLAWLAGNDIAAAPKKEAKNKTSLQNFRLTDLDGKDVTLTDGELKGQRVAFCFFTTWSGVAEKQARKILAQKEAIGGKLVFICSGPEREARDLRKRMGDTTGIWLKPDSQVGTAFQSAFDPEKVDRVPALIVIDATSRIVHASTGELSDDDLKAALSAKAE